LAMYTSHGLSLASLCITTLTRSCDSARRCPPAHHGRLVGADRCSLFLFGWPTPSRALPLHLSPPPSVGPRGHAARFPAPPTGELAPPPSSLPLAVAVDLGSYEATLPFAHFSDWRAAASPASPTGELWSCCALPHSSLPPSGRGESGEPRGRATLGRASYLWGGCATVDP
jgi:hypothetical protein